MQLLLAPMEGLLDFALRDTLTRVGASVGELTACLGAGAAKQTASEQTATQHAATQHAATLSPAAPPCTHPSGIDRCVSEFIRVTDTLLPARAFIRTMPELRTGGRTLSGVPVRGQLLGSDPTLLAENAARLAELGSHGVDLNFGCPAKVVNRHGGGSALLDDPEQVHRIVAAVRRAVPPHVPVSAKMRLGYQDDHRAADNALAIEAAGASEIVVHARTKAQGYRPPAYWDRIADLVREVKLPLVANGDIWTVEDALRCQQVSGCTSLMLGRGMVANPGLARAIRATQAAHTTYTTHTTHGPQGHAAVSWADMQPLMLGFWQWVERRVAHRHRAGRLKQWLNLLRRHHPEAQQAFEWVRTQQDPDVLRAWLCGLHHSSHAG